MAIRADAGLSMGGEEQKVVNALLAQLEELGKQQPPPLTNPFLWGNYVVAYTSNGKDQNGQAAGGRFRGTVGRNLFKTTGLFQSVLQPDLATNKVFCYPQCKDWHTLSCTVNPVLQHTPESILFVPCKVP